MSRDPRLLLLVGLAAVAGIVMLPEWLGILVRKRAAAA